MFRRFITKVLIFQLAIMFAASSVLAENEFPLTGNYSDGISSAADELFRGSRILSLIDTGFETNDEIEAIKSSEFNEKITISENKRSGKFALSVEYDTSEKLPIRETDCFYIGDNASTENSGTAYKAYSSTAATVSVDRDTISVFGTAASNKEITMLLLNGEEIAYIWQTTCDSAGKYDITFTVNKSGSYTLKLNGVADEILAIPLTVEVDSTDAVITSDLMVYSKCTEVSLWIKPMNNAQKIAFYTKKVQTAEDGTSTESFVPLTDGADADGYFEIGKSLSSGKWQQITLNLKSTEVDLAKDLYITANNSSKWLFDDIKTSYKKTRISAVNLSEMQKNNVAYTDNGLQFVADDNKEGTYKNDPEIVVGGVNIFDNISSVDIDASEIRKSVDTSKNQEVLFNEAFDSENWILNEADGNYLTEAIYRRQYDSSKETEEELTITRKSGEEKIRVSFMLSVDKAFHAVVNGMDIKYNDGNKPITSDWTTETIELYSGYPINERLEYLEIEYMKENDSKKNIIINDGSSVTVEVSPLTEKPMRAELCLGAAYETAEKVSDPLYVVERDKDGNELYRTQAVESDYLRDFRIMIPVFPETASFSIEYGTGGNTGSKLRIRDFILYSAGEETWNKEPEYSDNSIVYKNYYHSTSLEDCEIVKVKDVINTDNAFAVKNLNAVGIRNTGTLTETIEVPSASVHVLRVVNLSTEPQFIEDYWDEYQLGFGETTLVIESGYQIELPASEDVILLSATGYSNQSNNINNLASIYVEGMYKYYDVSQDGNTIYYINRLDNSFNAMNLLTRKVKCISESSDVGNVSVSANEAYAIVGDCLYNLNSELHENISGYTGTFRNSAITTNGEVIFSSKEDDTSYIYSYNNESLYEIDTENKTVSGIKLDKSEEKLIVYYANGLHVLYQKYNSTWNRYASFTADDFAKHMYTPIFANDCSTVYYGVADSDTDSEGKIYAYDIATDVSEELTDGNLIDVCENGSLLIYYEENVFVYNPVTGEKLRLFKKDFPDCGKNVMYNTTSLDFAAVHSDSIVIKSNLNSERQRESYLLSFDGKKTWLAYHGGSWLTAVENKIPEAEAFTSYGMTADEVNSINEAAFGKLYLNGDDVLRVDIAVYMYSDTKDYSPCIKQISVTTAAGENIGGLFSTNIEKFKKAEYAAVDNIFPVENFQSGAECYYLLYIGNEWLYTYKDGKLVKLDESADSLLENIRETYLTFKQYGMSAEELRIVPSDVLTSLFINSDYANDEFGVIYVIKTDSDNTHKYSVKFYLSADKKYISDDDVVLEIVLTGGDVKIIDSQEFSKNDIDLFMSWLEKRGTGKGDIFYRFKNATVQHFINYYMIGSVNVFDRDDYFNTSEE